MPKISAPLAKSIRTGEGILVYTTNVLLVIAAMLPHGMSWQHSALYLTILNGLHVVSRSGLKIAAVNAGLGITGGALPVATDEDPIPVPFNKD